MNLTIIDFETAKDLKELGFDWGTIFNFNKKGNIDCYVLVVYEADLDDLKINHNISTQFVSAPTQAEAVKWFRDEYKIVIEIIYQPIRVDNNWFVAIYDINNNDRFGCYDKSYEQAELAGIKKAIEILKDKKL